MTYTGYPLPFYRCLRSLSGPELELIMHLACWNAQEVAVLARCRAPNITAYYASVLKPGTTQLLIIMDRTDQPPDVA